MTSPFPGMNPYLEQDDAWEDFHGRFIVLAAESLERSVGPNYIVKIETHVYVHELPQEGHEQRRAVGRADVGVAVTNPTISPASGAAVLEAPVEVVLPNVDVERSRYLEIRDRRNRHLVTLLELLSPSNKTKGADREQFLAKRREVLASPANYVEIDLRRGGHRPQDDLPPSDYYVLVSRAAERPRAGVWPIGLRDSLPRIPVPLSTGDADATLDLKEMFRRVFDAAGYEKYIYENAPQPALREADAAWAAGLVTPIS